MFPPKTKMCHLTGFKTSCHKLVLEEKCQGRWTNIQWNNAQTGVDENVWACIDDMQVAVLLDQTRRLNGMAASLNSMRNEVTKLQVEQIARQERQHREAMAPLDHQLGLTRLDPPEPGVTLLTADDPTGEPN